MECLLWTAELAHLCNQLAKMAHVTLFSPRGSCLVSASGAVLSHDVQVAVRAVSLGCCWWVLTWVQPVGLRVLSFDYRTRCVAP